jgi:hypothetical protein
MPPKSDGNVLVFTSTRDGQELWPDSVYVQNLESVIEDPIAEIEKYRKVYVRACVRAWGRVSVCVDVWVCGCVRA